AAENIQALGIFLAFFIVAALILGIPFLIGISIGQATKSSSPVRQQPNLDAIWRNGYEAGIEYERRNQVHHPDVVPAQDDTQDSDLADTSLNPATPNTDGFVDYPSPPPPPSTPTAIQPAKPAPSTRPVP